jgi:hypothetical protein
MTDVYAGIRTRDNILDMGTEPAGTLQWAGTLQFGTQANVELNTIAVPAEDLPAHETIAALRKLVADMEHDWRQLNEFLNLTAHNRDWCPEYEERLSAYNSYFISGLRLVGRTHQGYARTWTTTDGT